MPHDNDALQAQIDTPPKRLSGQGGAPKTAHLTIDKPTCWSPEGRTRYWRPANRWMPSN
jgi:hypothetical protein